MADAWDLGQDWIYGFNATEGDRIDFTQAQSVNGLGDLAITSMGANTLISYDAGSITLHDIASTSVSQDWFVF